MTSFETFATPKTTQWTFVKPNPSKESTKYIQTVFEENVNTLCIAFMVVTDDTTNRCVQGFIETNEPFDMEMSMNSFGPAMHTPCVSRPHQNPVLTEILTDKTLHELGDVKSTEFDQKKKEIKSFKQDADTAMKKLVEETQMKHFEFFQCNPHLVLRYLTFPPLELWRLAETCH